MGINCIDRLKVRGIKGVGYDVGGSRREIVGITGDIIKCSLFLSNSSSLVGMVGICVTVTSVASRWPTRVHGKEVDRIRGNVIKDG